MFDIFDNPGFIPYMLECEGKLNTSEGCINRVANYLAQSPNDTIDTKEFRMACINCNVDPDSFTQGDLERIQYKLNKL